MSSTFLLRMMAGDDSDSLVRRLASDMTKDIDPLPSGLRRGLIPVAIMALLSFIASTSLLLFLIYRLIFWRRSYKHYIGYNQYIVLIFNLILADVQQSLAFIICFKWIATDKMKSGTAACFLQGLWLQIGDPGSGLFVLAIAFHTFLLVVWGQKMSYTVFNIFVIGVWGIIALIVIIPLALHGGNIYVPSGAWCWIGEEFETLRLWTHYIWIFLAEFGTMSLYAVMFLQLRRQIAKSTILGNSQLESLHRLRRVVGYMTIYPIVYIVLSLPLAAGRMATANGKVPSDAFFCGAGKIYGFRYTIFLTKMLIGFLGTLMTSSGLIDVVLYTLTRKHLLTDSEEPSQNRSYNRKFSKGRADQILTTITAEPNQQQTAIDETDRDGSTDNIVPSDIEMAPIGKVYQETTIEITHEPAGYPDEVSSECSSKDDNSPEPRREDFAKKWR
ncbi:Glucose receptor Git3 N-terminal [Penicillium taxi]|uniref:Glucose receptor Git3 N-terminal n=1 Tax=Penicillium taxi TaxID=168475 RepID=UPI0025459BCF|nr:Glucose receptor Git3 N-terminal [Penicillium taxi]KAJ5902232.1 Glucose receptor Git3 N-terminal [Penicillium taxi]